MKKKTLMGALALALSLLLAMTGCAGNEPSKPESQSPASSAGSSEASAVSAGSNEPAAAQEIQLDWPATNFYSFDINATYCAEESIVFSHVLEGLFRSSADENGKQTYVESGCESYTVSDDGLVYTFKLRDNKWSDGQKVTAQQYVDSFRRLGDPRNAFDYSYFIDDMVGGKELYTMSAEDGDAAIEAAMENLGAKAIDDNTLEITLHSPAPQIISKLGNIQMFPIRLDIIEKLGETYASDVNGHVFNGPFVITNYVKDNSMILEKNPDYWDAENIKLTKVTLTNVEDPSTEDIMFKNGELMCINPDGDYEKAYREGSDTGDYTVVTPASAGVEYFFFNRRTASPSGVMESQKCRLALSLAVDRVEYTQNVLGSDIPAYGYVNNAFDVGTTNYRENVPEPLLDLHNEYNCDPEKLQALFKEGLKDLNDTRELSDITIKIIATGTTARHKQKQEYFKQLWEQKLGVKVDMTVFGDNTLYREARSNGEYDMGYISWAGDYNDPMTNMDMFLTTGQGTKFAGWSDEGAAQYDKLLAPLSTTVDPLERVKIYGEAEKWLVAEEVALIPYLYTEDVFCLNNKVKNFKFPSFGLRYDFTHAYVEG